MSDVPISGLEELVGPVAANDWLAVVDRSDTEQSPDGSTRKVQSSKVGRTTAYSWRFTQAGDRAEWSDNSPSDRATYGTATDGAGRTVLSAAIVQDTGPPTTFSNSGSVTATWFLTTGIPVLAGDVCQFTFVAGWTKSADSLSPPAADVSPFGEPGYSVRQDRDGQMVRVYGSIDTDDSFGSQFDVAVMEPQWDWYAGGWIFTSGYYHPMPMMQAVAMENCNITPYANIGPIWGNLAGDAYLVSASLVVTTP